jgi:aminoglycoside phosphotransferase (APT) family kinase protein
MSQEFMRQRHATYTTPAHVIFDLIKEATGQDGQGREQIVRGYANEVYRVWTRQGEEFIVRIRQHGGLSFHQEAWAMTRCRDAGAPVPTVYLVKTIATADQPHEVMVVHSVPGRVLSDIQSGLTTAELAYIYMQVGAAMRAIHSIIVDGFSRLHTDGTWDFPDWSSLARAELRDRETDAPILRQAGLSTAEVEQLLQMISTMPILGCPQPVLCHGDLAADHFFIDDQLQLTGVIDFGQFQGGPPALDFAVLLMYHPELELAWLQRGYQPSARFDENFVRQLLVEQARVQMSYLAYDVRDGNADDSAMALQGLRTTLHAWERLHAEAQHVRRQSIEHFDK